MRRGLMFAGRRYRCGCTNTHGGRALRALAFSGLAIATLSTVLAAQTPVQTTTPAGNAQSGNDLYLKYSCYACHGYDGHGGAGARLVPLPLALPRFTAYVRSPRQMPPYTTQVLSDAQLADLWTYIKALPESPAAKNIPLLTRIMSEK